jgi:hypothetical protein
MLLAVVPKPFFLMNYHDSKLLSSGHNRKYLMYACTLCGAQSRSETVGVAMKSAERACLGTGNQHCRLDWGFLLVVDC